MYVHHFRRFDMALDFSRRLEILGTTYRIFSLPALDELGFTEWRRLPYSHRVLLENQLHHAATDGLTLEELAAFIAGQPCTLRFRPSRVLLQDMLGIPLLVDLAALREAVHQRGLDPSCVNPLIPVDLVIDHSVMPQYFGTPEALRLNEELECTRNAERFRFVRWAQKAFRNLRVVPPGNGIMHQVDLEFLSRVVWMDPASDGTPATLSMDTLVGTDSHTPMVNGLAVLGWGVGGLEAESAMLGRPLVMNRPPVLGVALTGMLKPGVTATDLVLTITETLRKVGVVDQFVEFTGPGLAGLSVAERATIANMAPEYGATAVFFPVDAQTIDYLKLSGRGDEHAQLVEAYSRHQGLWREPTDPEPRFDRVIPFDLSEVRPSLAGPRRPQDRVNLESVPENFENTLRTAFQRTPEQSAGRHAVPGTAYDLGDGDVVIAAITSCTNTANPANMIAAGLLARNAALKGLRSKPWVKATLAPGSLVVADYLDSAGLQPYLDTLGFYIVGFGCTTCNGMSGPLPEPIRAAIEANDLVCTAVLSGNRNFEARIHPNCRANYLASPPLVVVYALTGTVNRDLTREAIGTGRDGQPVYLRDIWPDPGEVQETVRKHLRVEMFAKRYAPGVWVTTSWAPDAPTAAFTYPWVAESTYLQKPPFVENVGDTLPPFANLVGLRPLAILGDSITTDHISPSGAIGRTSVAGRFLLDRGTPEGEFNTYGTRRGNYVVAARATFANIQLRNEAAPGPAGSFARIMPEGTRTTVFEAAEEYRRRGVPLIVIAGKEYGCGSSRDWAAKGPKLLGIRAVLAESFERIHRTNLVSMGILPLVFPEGVTRITLALDGSETFDLPDLAAGITPRSRTTLRIHRVEGSTETLSVFVRLDTQEEVDTYQHGGLLPQFYRELIASHPGKPEA